MRRYKDVHTHAGTAAGETAGFVVGERYERGTHRVTWSVPLRDWLALEAAGSSLG